MGKKKSNSIQDLLDDPIERERLSKYVDLTGVDSFNEFKKRIQEGFNTAQGSNFLKNVSVENMKSWYNFEGVSIVKALAGKPIHAHKKRGKEERVHYFGYERGMPVGIVRKEFVEIKGNKQAVYRDSKGRFASIKK